MTNNTNFRHLKTIFIVILTIVIVFILYNFVWLQSMHYMKADRDNGTYSTGYTNYCNGILSVVNIENNSLEIFENDTKKVVNLNDFPEKNTPYYYRKYLAVNNGSGFSFYDFNFEKAGEIIVGEKVDWHSYNNENCYCGNLKNIYKCDVNDFSKELVFSADSFEIHNCWVTEKNMYIEYLNNDKTISTVIAFNVDDKKITDKYEVDITNFNLQNESFYSISKNGRYLYYQIDVISSPVVYRYDIIDNKMEFVAQFQGDIQIKKNDIYYVGTANKFKTQTQKLETIGLWKLSIDTMETSLITDKVDYKSFYFCTDNYVYSYKKSYIGWDNDGSSIPSFRIYRGYTIEQIELN